MSYKILNELLGPTLPIGTPETRAITVMTADGQIAIDGTSKSLGSALDAQLLQKLRLWSDVVLVGAETVRAEDYGGVVVPAQARAIRRARGQQEVPPIAVISRSQSFDLRSRFFREADIAPIILSPRPADDSSMNVVHVPDEDYVGALRRLGYPRITIEGGPSVFARTFSQKLVDRFHLTIDPSLAVSAATPLMPAAAPGPFQKLFLEHHHVDAEGCVFLRYRVRK